MFWYKGNRFEDLDEIAKAYDLTFSELMERIQMSSRGVVSLRKGYFGIRKEARYAYGLKTYERLEDVADDLGVSYVAFLSRMRVGDDGVVRFKPGFSDFKKKSVATEVMLTTFTYAGDEYVGFPMLADATGVPLSVLKKIVRKTGSNDVTDGVKTYLAGLVKYRVVDTEYRYVKEVADLFRVRRVLLDSGLRRGKTLEESVLSALDLAFLGAGDGSFWYEGDTFSTVIELYDRVTGRDVVFADFVRDLWDGKYANDVTIRYEAKPGYEWECTTYYSIKELANACGLSVSSLKRLSKEKGSVSEAMEELFDRKRKKKYLLNGEYFASIAEMAAHTKMTTHGFRKDVLKTGMVKRRGDDGFYYRYYG